MTMIFSGVNSLDFSDSMCHGTWLNIGSGNGLVPDGTKPLHELMLNYHQWGPAPSL